MPFTRTLVVGRRKERRERPRLMRLSLSLSNLAMQLEFQPQWIRIRTSGIMTRLSMSNRNLVNRNHALGRSRLTTRTWLTMLLKGTTQFMWMRSLTTDTLFWRSLDGAIFRRFGSLLKSMTRSFMRWRSKNQRASTLRVRLRKKKSYLMLPVTITAPNGSHQSANITKTLS